VLRCQALAGPTYEATRTAIRAAFADYGLPDRIRSDNGGPFASHRSAPTVAVVGLVDPAGHPGSNASRSATRAKWIARAISLGAQSRHGPAPAANARAQQRRFTRFCAEYKR